jgi:hypothetical protein
MQPKAVPALPRREALGKDAREILELDAHAMFTQAYEVAWNLLALRIVREINDALQR